MNTRPAPVPAQSVAASFARAIAVMFVPPFVVPHGDVAVAFVSVTLPSGGQFSCEPHAPVNSRSLGNSPTAVLQWFSRNVRSPPAVVVRHTRCAPTKIVFVWNGSEIVGGRKRIDSLKPVMNQSPIHSHDVGSARL